MMRDVSAMENYDAITAIRVRNRGLRAAMPKVSPQASFVLKRLFTTQPKELPAVTGIQQSALLGYLDELQRAGLIDIDRSDAQVSSAVTAPAPVRARPRDIVESKRQPRPQPPVAATPPTAAAPPPTPPPTPPQPSPQPPTQPRRRVDLTNVARVVPAPAALTVRRDTLPPSAVQVLAELDGPLALQDLLAATGLTLAEASEVLAELGARELIYLIRDEVFAPPAADAGTPAPAKKPAGRRLRPVESVFPDNPFAQAEAIAAPFLLHKLYEFMRGQKTATLFWRYGDKQVWALRMVDGYPAAYRTNRDEDAWKVGKLLQQIVGLSDAAVNEALGAQGAASGRIGDLLVARGYLSPEQLQIALQRQKGTGKLLGDVLVQEKLIATELLGELLTMQRRSRMRIGELLIDLEYLTPKDVEQALTMQMRWVVREILLLGPPTEVAVSFATWPYGNEEEPKRFGIADWLLKCGRRQRDQVQQAGWLRAWAETPKWVNRPAPSQQLQRAQLTLEERKAFDTFMDTKGGPLSEAAAECALICAGLLEPLESKGAAGLPPWLALTDDFQLLGLHWACLPTEVEAAVETRLRDVAALATKLGAAETERLRQRLDKIRRTLLDEEQYRAIVAARHTGSDREHAAELLIERGVSALHLRADWDTAQDCADRILRICWNVTAPLAAGCYIGWGVALQRGKAADGRRLRARLQTLVENHKNTAEVHYYYAMLLALEGDRRAAAHHAKTALALNPYLKEAKKLLAS